MTAEWEPFAPIGPQVAFHTACIIRGALFVHGGVREKDGKQPSADLHRLDLSSGMWTQVSAQLLRAFSYLVQFYLYDLYRFTLLHFSSIQ